MNKKLITGIIVGALMVPAVSFAADEIKTDKNYGIKANAKNAGSEVKEAVGDSVITTRIKADFAKDKAVSATNVRVNTDQRGMVVLSGTAKSRAETDKAVSIAKATKGVTSVQSEFTIQP